MKFTAITAFALAVASSFTLANPVPVAESDSHVTGDFANNAVAKIPGPVVNDYPYKGKCSGVDPWRYYKCNCVSFVAWRINKRLGIKFNNSYKGAKWGNANTWDEAARKTKVKINKTPVAGSIAQLNRKTGHVAWVTKVSGNKVTVEEYNWNVVKGYGTRTVDKSYFENYIHIKV